MNLVLDKGMQARPQWQEVADKLVLLFDPVAQRHVQFQGFTPDLPARSYICPEDVMYLTWPMGPYLNLSTEVISKGEKKKIKGGGEMEAQRS